VPLFRDLDETYLREISEMFLTERIPTGRTVITQGDEGTRFYIIIHGKVAVTVSDEKGNTMHVATLDDGDYFGEIALLADIPTTASVVTLVPSIFITLQREQLNKLVSQHAGLREQMGAALESRKAQTDAIAALSQK
jgi:ATP-binding cassette, subfamily B, bacterial